MSNKKHHAEWLALLEGSGPFVSLPILEKVFPQGLDAHDPDHARRMRLALDEWETNQTGHKPNPAIHNAWIQFVLTETLALSDEVLASGQAIPQTLKATHAEAGEIIRPDFVVRNPTGVPDEGKPRLVIQVFPADQQLEKHVYGLRWKASPADRMAELLKQTKCPLGLVTNGEHWILANKTEELPTGFVSFYSGLWLEEPITLRAFRSLLGAGRFFGALPGQTLAEMLVESATHQQEVTDQLGRQVRRAVEVLIQSLDRADQDDKVLAGVPETVLYEAALTVMMRLVFLFCAEERKLLLLGDPLYDQHYAVSTLVAQLQETADNHGEEILQRRLDAWSRLLSTFRAVFGGVQHERMKLPAYAGNLFDPDRFPFLEGRKPKTSWQDTPASPLPVNNRTVLHLLRSLQYLQLHGEAQRISFEALGIEQIGHVYEGLLDHTAKRATEPVLGLVGSKGEEPEVALAELEKQQAKGEAELVEFLHDQTGRSASALKNALGVELEGEGAGRLRAACGNDKSLYERVKPFAALIRNDSFDRPVVVRKGSVYVTTGTDRRTSGTHYTPTSLTEPIVKHTLDPLCYVGPAEGKPEDEWQLRSAKELLDFKICDMACGSGAFLVQACRYLSELLVEAWEQAAEKASGGKPPANLRITPYGELSTGAPGEQLIPTDTEERLVYARRLVAQRCLYGVDINPLAVEMAKLSLWLLTLAKDKPFTFLDHCIRPGDSLVGISSIEQLLRFSLSENISTGPLLEKQRQQIENRLNAVKLLRKQIEELPSNTSQDIERKTQMLTNAEEQTRRLTYAADLLLAASWEPMSAGDREIKLNLFLAEVEHKFKDLPVEQLNDEAAKRLSKAGVGDRFHWPMEFPEVFEKASGFGAFVCNPPFMGGQKITGTLGDSYREYLVTRLANGLRGSADLCSYFFLRAAELLRDGGQLGFLATNTIAQGDTREVGLEQLTGNGCVIPRAVASRPWPGTASLEVAHVWVRRGSWSGRCVLNEQPTSAITAFLTTPGAVSGKPYRLLANEDKSFIGTYVLGMGFVLEPKEAQRLIEKDSSNKDVLFPYLNGEDLNSRPDPSPSRWVINFFDWPLDRESAPKSYQGPVASDYPDCLAIVEAKVKPERMKLKRKVRRERWWQFAERCPALYATIKGLENVLVLCRVTKYLSVVVAPTGWVYSIETAVFSLNAPSWLPVLQSSIYEPWVREYTSTLETRLRFSPSDCFETFPLPTIDSPAMTCLGESYHNNRRQLMVARQEGLTKTYNRFHDSSEVATDIQKLRDLHVEMDQAVAAAYGWDDLELGHGFHETKQGIRFTISEPVRREVLQRLLKLNHERYAEEVKQGLHGKTKPSPGKAAMGSRKKAAAASGPGLFNKEVVDPAFPSTARERLMCAAMLNLVRSSSGLPTPDYLDALLLATHPNDCQPLLTESDQTSFQRAAKKVPKELIDDTNEVPWREVRQALLGNKSLREVNAEGTTQLMPGETLEAVAATFPAIETAYLQLVGKAAQRLREIISTVQPSGSKEAGIVRRFNELREATMKS
jgi:hypothetical protein